ncbi:uncharacterized protein LOC123516639 isoform X2 [Portunus trituberculatus]|nr:uncharacterized protein LOC123516639 isoform X2 [Portunus trituberculatus]XP_045132166.1 uncharacterized protein LOC123516639 isoform X2 [Portunus trituberculatus]
MDETLLGNGSSGIVCQAIKDDILKMGENMTMVCQICKITMTGITPAEAHLQGSKHKKAVQKFKLDAAMEQNCDSLDSSTSIVQTAIKSRVVSCDHTSNQMMLTCVLCNKTCSGEVPMMQHLSSEAHTKKMRHGSLISNITSSREKSPIPNTSVTQYDSASPTNVPPSMESFAISDREHPMDFKSTSAEVQAAMESGLISSTKLGNQVLLTCVPCNKPCSGEVPMMQHLNSEAHAKKMRHGVQFSSFSPQMYVPTLTTPIPTMAKCSLTSADVTAVQGDVLPQAIKEGTVKASEHTANHLKCTVCDVPCTGEDSMREHLQGKSHLKMMKVFQQTSKQLLRSSSVSSTMHITAVQHSPSTPEHDKAHTDRGISPAHFSPVSPASGWEELSLEDGIVLKSEDGFKCTVCGVTCNSQNQMINHLQGDPHKRQYRVKQTAHLLAGTPESLGRSPMFPVTSTTNEFGSTNVLSPPSKFRDSPHCNTPPTEKMKLEERGSSFIKESSNSSKKNFESYKKGQSKNIIDLLDIKIYGSKDPLSDLFSE